MQWYVGSRLYVSQMHRVASVTIDTNFDKGILRIPSDGFRANSDSESCMVLLACCNCSQCALYAKYERQCMLANMPRKRLLEIQQLVQNLLWVINNSIYSIMESLLVFTACAANNPLTCATTVLDKAHRAQLVRHIPKCNSMSYQGSMT